MKKLVILLPVLLLSATAMSQSLLIAAGIATDSNNPGNPFNFIPVEIQWYPFEKTTLSLVCHYDAGLNAHGKGDAYTLTPSLPGHITLKEKYRTNILTIGASLNMGIYTGGNHNKVYFSIMPLAYCLQDFKAAYKNYDNTNYEILDPDISKRHEGFTILFGIQYHFNRNKQLALHFQSPLLLAEDKSSNYMYAAPVRLMFGYHYHYKKDR